MDSPKNSNQIIVEKWLLDKIEAAKKELSVFFQQHIAEKGLLDKIEVAEKKFSDFVPKIEAAVEAGTISNEQAQTAIEQEQTAIERLYKNLADLQAEWDGLRKEPKEVDGRLSSIETAIAEMMETEDERKALLDNVRSIFRRFTEIKEKITEITEKEYTEIKEKITEITKKEYLENHPDKHKRFFYFYLLFGLLIVAVGVDILLNLFHR